MTMVVFSQARIVRTRSCAVVVPGCVPMNQDEGQGTFGPMVVTRNGRNRAITRLFLFQEVSTDNITRVYDNDRATVKGLNNNGMLKFSYGQRNGSLEVPIVTIKDRLSRVRERLRVPP